MPNFTKESVHQAFCNLPEEQKMDFVEKEKRWS